MTRRTHPRNLRLLGETGGAPHVAEPGPLATDTRLLEQPIRLNRKAAPVAHTLPPPSDSERGARRSLRSRWLPKVYLAPVSDGTKLLLVLLAEDMREDGYVSVPRDELARRLGRHPGKVSARLKEAVEARLLDRVVPGHKGTTAVYRALLPNAQSVPHGGDATTKSPTAKPPLHRIDRAQFTSALLSSEKKNDEVEARGGEPQPLAVVFEGLFGKRGAA